MTTISQSTTGSISSAGIGSGLDVNSIITSLMQVESLPLTALQNKASTLQTTLSAFGQVQSLVSSLQDATKPLYDSSTYQLTSTGSTDPSSVSAGTSAGAVPGSYSVAVSSLAASQSVVSASGQYTDGTSVVGAGTLTIRLGTWSTDATGASSFAPANGSSDVSVVIDASHDTLAGVRDQINAANAGVTASIVTDANGARLALQSTSTGAANGFRVVASGTPDANGVPSALSNLTYNPAAAGSQLTLAQSAANAQATINGIPVSSASNTLSGVIDGITFNLGKTTTQPVTINVSRNTDSIKQNVQAFVSAYNALNSFLATETKYDATTKTASTLQGDPTANAIQSRMHTLLSDASGASSTFRTLSSLGVQLQSDGSLKLDDTAFAAAAQNVTELGKALGNVDPANAGNNGFGKVFYDWTDSLLNSSGTLTGKETSIKNNITSNQKDQDAMQTRLDATKARLQAQYTALDTTMSKANALAQYVQQQFYSKSSFGSSSSSSSN